jgi:hypothetical protein
MQTYQPYIDFTAQSHNISALMRLYAQLEKNPQDAPPLTTIIVFAAFSVEAYINSIGAKKVDFWEEIERLPWRKKVVILHKHAGATPDWSKDPLQFALEVFRIRDNLAHGKPERVLGPVCSDHKKAEELLSSAHLKPDWFKTISKEWVAGSKDRLRVLMIYLGQLYGFHESDHLLHATGGIQVDA